MVLIENLMTISLVTFILGLIIALICVIKEDINGYCSKSNKIIGGFGGLLAIASLCTVIFLFGYSDSLEAKMRVDIAKCEDKIYEQVDVIKNLNCDNDSKEFKDEVNKLKKYIREYNSAVRKYTEEETYPKKFYFYKYDDGKLVTNGTNRDYR